jgi:hypothetical protein
MNFKLHYLCFLGPDGIADHRTHMPTDKRVIGNNCPTSMLTSDTDYLWRTNPQGTPVHLCAKSAVPGEIGWHCLYSMSFPSWTGHEKLVHTRKQNIQTVVRGASLVVCSLTMRGVLVGQVPCCQSDLCSQQLLPSLPCYYGQIDECPLYIQMGALFLIRSVPC